MKLLCLIRHKWRNGVVIVRQPEFESSGAFVNVKERGEALCARRCIRCGLHEVESRAVGWCVLHQIKRFVELPERGR